MRVIDKSKPVLVTGGAGYMASWIIKMLLDEGINVNATVRDPADVDKVEHLMNMGSGSKGKLKLYKADLLEYGSFEEAMKDCELVMHTASPFFIQGIQNPEKDLIRPAKEGTKNVLESAKRNQTVKRIILTSSMAAIYGDNVEVKSTSGNIFSEKFWNTTSSIEHQPYRYSKTLAEKEAWAIAKSQDQWDLVVINPALIFGPSLSKRKDSSSVNYMIKFGDGTYRNGVPRMWYSIVDVRDVAHAHIKAGFTPEAKGRHIISSGETTVLEIASTLRKHFGDTYAFPRRQVPKFLMWLIAPKLGFTRKYICRNVAHHIKLDNSYSKADLGMRYRTIDQTIIEHFQQVVDNGLSGHKV